MCQKLEEVWQLEENPLEHSCFLFSLLTLLKNFLENLCGMKNKYGLSAYGDKKDLSKNIALKNSHGNYSFLKNRSVMHI